MPTEKTIQTPFGVFSGIVNVEHHPDGTIKGIRLEEKNVIITHAGDLIPYYSEETVRRKYKSSVEFHKNGMIKSISLDKQQDVMTPIGEFPAEFVTFYDSGELKRVFPLDGKLSGFWSEDDERNLNIPFHFEFDFSAFTAQLIGLCFYKSGSIKSLTLYPGEVIDVTIQNDFVIQIKNGFSLYENGSLKSIEPALPVTVQTPMGALIAYDTDSIGINADLNSLNFDEEGRINHLLTSNNKIAAFDSKGKLSLFVPGEIQDPLDEESVVTIPLGVGFNYENESVSITDAAGIAHDFILKDTTFKIYSAEIAHCSPTDCASCHLCSGK